MPFNQNAPDGEETTNALRIAWIGLAANCALLASYTMNMGEAFTAPALGITGAFIFVLLMSNRLDDYFNSLRNVGLRWGMVVIGLYLFAGALVYVYLGGHALGSFAASGDLHGIERGRLDFFSDGYLLAILAGLAFHAGFAFARLRGTGAR